MEQFVLWGSFVNVFAIIGGSIIGLLFKHFMMGNKKSPRMEALSDHILKGIALCVLGIGIMGTIKGSVNDQIVNALAGSYAGSADHPIQLVADLAGDRTLIIILSMMFGSLIGQLLDIDRGVNFLGAKIGELVRSRFGNVEQGFVTASLVFCVGSMTIVGALNSGLLNDHTMLYTKSVLDFVTAIVFAMSLGIGVMFSSAFLLVFQGTITLFAQWIAPFLSNEVITCMSVTGSILIIGLALNLLGSFKLKVMNYMPSIFMPAILIPLADWLGTLF